MATVLIIEDDRNSSELLRMALSCEGHGVITAENGSDGLRQLEEHSPCVILLDLMMPVMDGLTFLAERHKRGLAQDVPIVCITAGGEEIQNHALTLGARECLHKPTDFDELCERIRHYCE